MKTYCLLLAGLTLGLLGVCSSAADTPEAIVQRQMATMRAGDWKGFTALMHDSALQEFRTSFTSLLEAVPEGEARTGILQGLFGGKAQSEVVALEPAAFFATFMESLSNVNPMMKQGLSGAEGEVLGHVDEGPDKTHVVMRLKLTMGDINVTKMDVTSLKRDGDSWKTLLSGDIQTMVAGMMKAMKGK
ncbi:MAG TPA: hypothetical protein VGO90_12215 [Chthoniobacteraceae bacterium]|jgi:hypothetical protein|nr:hypothetical protein [Chthoniobacter sp.]HEV7868440.1 hypothetical protein [Chthoniobacteraceae bacterium]